MEQSPSREANRFSASQEIPQILWNPKVSLQYSQQPVTGPCPEPDQSSPHHPFMFLEDPSHLRPGLPSGPFPAVSPPNPCKHLSPLIHATCPAYLIPPDLSTILGEQYRSFSSPIRNFLHFLFTSSLFGPNIPLIPLFANTLSLRSSLNVSDQVSHPHKTAKL